MNPERPFEKRRPAPVALRRWRKANPGPAPWEALGTDVKDALRDALRSDQEGLCGYCHRQLASEERVRIAHIAPQTDANRFAWENLALSCDGDEPRDPHCDVAQRDVALAVVHPYQRPVSQVARLRFDGHLDVPGGDPDVTTDVERTLRLNCRTLVGARRAALRAWTVDLPARKPWKARSLDATLAELESRAEPTSFQPLIEQWLRRRLEQSDRT